MNCSFNSHIAVSCGINSALIAGYLWSAIDEDNCVYSKYWVRCGLKTMQAAFPFMGEQALANAVKRLVKNKVIIKREFNSNRFDRTSWYAFTDYGETLMQEAEYDS